LEYRILGPFEVCDGGEPIDIGARQQRALLAILLIHANRVVATERILEDLWPDDPLGKERTLWVYISRLRSILDPDRDGRCKSTVLLTRDHGYELVVAPDDIDAHRFEQLAQHGRELLRDDPASAAADLRRALGLWRGTALEDFQYDDFARADASRLDDLRLGAIEDRIDADIRAGHHREVIGELEQLVVGHPERERFVGQLMIALYRSGRQADALRAFERYRRTIGEQLGIEPSPELRRIEEQVLLHDARLAPPTADREDLLSAVNPFNGLHAFTEADAERFFGRDRLVASLVRRLAAGSRLLALVGASGSGKSSVLHAGLVTAVRKGAVEGSDDWLIALMVPGSQPFREAEAALLRSTLDAPDGLGAVLDEPEDGLLRACLRLLPDSTSRVLLVIDQFEELFTLGAPPPARDRFIRNLEVLLDDPYGRVVVAIGLRADLYGLPLEYPVFAEMLADGIVNVVPLTPDELESAAEEPAARAGATLEPALLVQLLSDVAGRPGGLPLFQYALTELFDRRDGALLTLDAYHEMGGVSGAIARRAEDLFLSLGPDERDAAKQLFLRLVTIADQGAWGRRRVAAGEIAAISTDLVALQTVLDRFAEHRLLTLDRDPVTGSPTVEVAHEALLDQWPRLRRWIDDGRRDVLAHARLATALTEWEASGRQPGYLLSGQRLADYEEWARTSTLRLSTTEQRFLDVSLRQRDADQLAEDKRVARETKLDRTAKRRLWVLGAVTVTLVAGLVGGFVLFTGGGQPAIAVVHGAPGDLGISDMLIGGVGDAERERDVEIDLVEPLVDAEEELRRLAESGTDLVVVSGEWDLEVNSVALDYPDVRWVAIDPAFVKVEGPNISEIHFAVEHSAFLAGAAAALSSETDKVGFIGGYQTFRTEGSRNGFERGVEWIDQSITVVATYIGPVANPITRADADDDLAYELASAMYADGVDVIFHDAGAAGAGVTRAANDWSATRQVWTIGSDVDEFVTLRQSERGVVLTSTIKRFDVAVEAAVADFLDGDLAAGETVLGLADEAVELSRKGDHLTAVDGQLQNLEGELAGGHISVSPFALRPAGWQAEPDAVIHLTQTNDDCEVDRVTVDGETTPGAELADDELVVSRGDVVVVELTNASSDFTSVIVRTADFGTTNADLDAAQPIASAGPLGIYHGVSGAQPGGRTSTAAVVSESPLSIACWKGPLPTQPTDARGFHPLIVRPS
jgi:basic membrane lipoprotein Med (substrate-binding protein (PBP1-ABC) superfamily)/DNA-binding SARP family transcriptional activator